MIMKSIFFGILILLVANGCSVSESPVFEDIDKVKVQTLNLRKIVIDADLNFTNPNDVGCDLVSTNIAVLANGIEVGYVTQRSTSLVGSNEEFSIPVSISMSPKEIFKKGSGFLGSTIGAITNKEVELEYSGLVMIEKLGVQYPIEIEETQVVVLKK